MRVRDDLLDGWVPFLLRVGGCLCRRGLWVKGSRFPPSRE